MRYIKRILFGIAWLLYRSLNCLLMLPAFIVILVIVQPIYYIKNGTVCGFEDKVNNYVQDIWDWINEFDPDEQI